MTWEKLARDIVGLGAPVLGRALAGPIGETAGDIVARALGVAPEPMAVRKAIERAPETARVALTQAEASHADNIWDAHARALEAINATMRREAEGDRIQRWWRPFVGYVFGVLSLLYGAVIIREIGSGRFDVIAKTTDIIWFFGLMAAVVGVSAAGRTMEKFRN